MVSEPRRRSWRFKTTELEVLATRANLSDEELRLLLAGELSAAELRIAKAGIDDSAMPASLGRAPGHGSVSRRCHARARNEPDCRDMRLRGNAGLRTPREATGRPGCHSHRVSLSRPGLRRQPQTTLNNTARAAEGRPLVVSDHGSVLPGLPSSAQQCRAGRARRWRHRSTSRRLLAGTQGEMPTAGPEWRILVARAERGCVPQGRRSLWGEGFAAVSPPTFGPIQELLSVHDAHGNRRPISTYTVTP